MAGLDPVLFVCLLGLETVLKQPDYAKYRFLSVPQALRSLKRGLTEVRGAWGTQKSTSLSLDPDLSFKRKETDETH